MKKIFNIFALVLVLSACDEYFLSSDFVNPNLPPYTSVAAGTVGCYINNYAWRHDETYNWWGGAGYEALTAIESGDTTWLYLRGSIYDTYSGAGSGGQEPLPTDINNYNYLEIILIGEELPEIGASKSYELDGSSNGFFRFTQTNSPSNPGIKTNPGTGNLMINNDVNYGLSGTFSANLTSTDELAIRVTHGRFDN